MTPAPGAVTEITPGLGRDESRPRLGPLATLGEDRAARRPLLHERSDRYSYVNLVSARGGVSMSLERGERTGQTLTTNQGGTPCIQIVDG
jgi:hypothetical protein